MTQHATPLRDNAELGMGSSQNHGTSAQTRQMNMALDKNVVRIHD